MNNNEKPAMPIRGDVDIDDKPSWVDGLTKREYACIHCGVPATGDPDLDAIISEGNRIQKAMIDAPVIEYSGETPDLSKINVE